MWSKNEWFQFDVYQWTMVNLWTERGERGEPSLVNFIANYLNKKSLWDKLFNLIVFEFKQTFGTEVNQYRTEIIGIEAAAAAESSTIF